MGATFGRTFDKFGRTSSKCGRGCTRFNRSNASCRMNRSPNGVCKRRPNLDFCSLFFSSSRRFAAANLAAMVGSSPNSWSLGGALAGLHGKRYAYADARFFKAAPTRLDQGCAASCARKAQHRSGCRREPIQVCVAASAKDRQIVWLDIMRTLCVVCDALAQVHRCHFSLHKRPPTGGGHERIQSGAAANVASQCPETKSARRHASPQRWLR